VARFYRLVRLVLDLLVLRGRRDRSKDVEILVLRHQLPVLQRQIARPLARALGRDRRSRPGRPSTTLETRRLLLRCARENPTWGYRRMHRELARLSIHLAASTVWAILKHAGIDPAPTLI
jgi:putative transposase